ncbi:MAG: hypothetical protein DI582_06185 [Azospirillum brasilense]|nr:MAG: hypothetical protein DI582_06185 [Azospirillum brasilense]
MSRINARVAVPRGYGLIWGTGLFALGIALYFLLSAEPPLVWLWCMVAVLLLFSCWPWRGRVRWRPLWALLIWPCLGVTWAATSTALHTPTMLRYELSPRPVQGVVRDMERTENGVRLTLGAPEIRGLAPEDTPAQVRLSVRLSPTKPLAMPQIGDEVSLLAGLLPPMGAATPGGFDFARYFYFRNIGAVGYGLPPWKIVRPAEQTGFAQWRVALTERIIAQLGPQRGPIAAGLITGEDRAIREADFDALKASNLYHIIAISGGHMVVIAGVVFVGLRLLLLLAPRSFGLRPEAKAIAAAMTLLVVTAYLFVTGMPISAVRAYVMIALVLLAILLRREADTLRSLFLAALIMLVLDPSDLMEPGFQLSFVATLGIVALAQARWLNPRHEVSLAGRAARALAGLLLIAVVAEGATALLVASMFNTFAPYGVLANAIATPLVALLLMPAVALFFVLLPFGLEGVALVVLDYGIMAMLALAHHIAALPHAQLFVPGPPRWGLAAGLAGLALLCLLRGRTRWLGLAGLVLGWASMLSVQPPVLLVGSQAKQIALATPEGYRLVRGRPDSLVPQLWANALGMRELPVLKPGTDAWRCDRFGCVATVEDARIAFPQDALAAMQDCARADWVISNYRLRDCARPMTSGYALERLGSHAFWMRNGTLWHENSADWQGNRPWGMGWRAAR